jgi:hypothetical protein
VFRGALCTAFRCCRARPDMFGTHALGPFASSSSSQTVSVPPRSTLVCPAPIVPNPHTTIDSSLYAYWPFNEGTGTAATPTGQFTTTGTLSSVTWAIGRVGAGVSFNGNAFIQYNIPSTAVSQTFTVAMWVKPTSTITIVSEATSGATGTTGQRYIIDPLSGAFSGRAGCMCSFIPLCLLPAHPS